MFLKKKNKKKNLFSMLFTFLSKSSIQEAKVHIPIKEKKENVSNIFNQKKNPYPIYIFKI